MRTLSYANFFKDGATECENLVLMCMDFRFRKQICDVISYAGYRDFDLLVLPGSSKAVTDGQTREDIFSAIEIAVAVHGVKRVIIVDHIDCRAYGGSEVFKSVEEEEIFHHETLREAAEILHGRFPELEIVPVYADWYKVMPIN